MNMGCLGFCDAIRHTCFAWQTSSRERERRRESAMVALRIRLFLWYVCFVSLFSEFLSAGVMGKLLAIPGNTHSNLMCIPRQFVKFIESLYRKTI